MAKLVVDSITSTTDIVDLINYLTQALADADTQELLGDGSVTLKKKSIPSIAELEDIVRFDDNYECEIPFHRINCTCQRDATHDAPPRLLTHDTRGHTGPIPLMACTKHGSHSKLTDCWMCWSDVYREVILPTHALWRPIS